MEARGCALLIMFNYGTGFDVFVKCSRPLRMRAEMTLPQQQSKRPGAQPANTWMNWSWLWSEARPALAPRALCRTGVSWLQPSHLVMPSSRATVRLAGTALGIWRSAGRLTRAPRAPCRRGASLGEAWCAEVVGNVAKGCEDAHLPHRAGSGVNRESERRRTGPAGGEILSLMAGVLFALRLSFR